MPRTVRNTTAMRTTISIANGLSGRSKYTRRVLQAIEIPASEQVAALESIVQLCDEKRKLPPPFLIFPAEVRNQIYELVLDAATPGKIDLHEFEQPSLVLVNKQIRSETLPMMAAVLSSRLWEVQLLVCPSREAAKAFGFHRATSDEHAQQWYTQWSALPWLEHVEATSSTVHFYVRAAVHEYSHRPNFTRIPGCSLWVVDGTLEAGRGVSNYKAQDTWLKQEHYGIWTGFHALQSEVENLLDYSYADSAEYIALKTEHADRKWAIDSSIQPSSNEHKLAHQNEDARYDSLVDKLSGSFQPRFTLTDIRELAHLFHDHRMDPAQGERCSCVAQKREEKKSGVRHTPKRPQYPGKPGCRSCNCLTY